VRPTSGQVYYSLKEQRVVKENGVEAWDMAFSCTEGRYDILLNTARGMGSYNTHSKDFDAYYANDKYPWEFDKNDGQKNQSSLGAWGDFDFDNPQSFGDIYLISLGVDLRGEHTGIVKLRINEYSENRYSIKVGDLEGVNEREYVIERNDSFNYVYLSFEKNGVLHLEPPKNQWDLLFSPYTARRKPGKTPPLLFSVTKEHNLVDGVLLNPYHRHVAIDTISDFDDIDFFDVESYVYSDTTNTIGQRWYAWFEERLQYKVTRENTFIIKDNDKNYYAIEFESYEPIQSLLSKTTFRVKSL